LNSNNWKLGVVLDEEGHKLKMYWEKKRT